MLASLEVSTRLCSTALFDLEKNTPVGEVILSQEHESSVTLLPGLKKLLEEKNLKPTDITALAVAVGPGSFTGIRVGIATAEGFSIPHQLPVYGISTLDGLAENLRWAGRLGEGLCLVDASRNECFVGRYRIEADGFHELEPAAIRSLAEIGGMLQDKKWIIGPGALKYENELKKFAGQAQWVEAALQVPSAMSLARIAYGRWKNDERPSLEELKPLYLRIPSVDEKKP